MCIGFFFYVTHVGTELKHEAITGVTEAHASGVYRVGKPSAVIGRMVENTFAPQSVLLAYLLDVNASPSKHIH